jgi:hypothetical protein
LGRYEHRRADVKAPKRAGNESAATFTGLDYHGTPNAASFDTWAGRDIEEL